jgi:hypothetical protein
MKKMIYNKILRVLPATTIFLVSTILAMSTFTNVSTSAFAQSGITNQTMQKEDQSTNQTSEAIQQNVSDVVTNISKGAKSGIKYYY